MRPKPVERMKAHNTEVNHTLVISWIFVIKQNAAAVRPYVQIEVVHAHKSFRQHHNRLAPSESSSDQQERTSRDLPTDQNHRPVLHILQLADAGVLGLFALNRRADDVEQLLLFAHPAFFTVEAESRVSSAV